MKQHKDLILILIVARIVFLFCVGGLVLKYTGLMDMIKGTSAEDTVSMVAASDKNGDVVISYVKGNSRRASNSASRQDMFSVSSDSTTQMSNSTNDEDDMELTDEETTILSEVVCAFFDALCDRDEDKMVSVITSRLNFMGKKNATKVDVLQYMKQLYAEDVTSIRYHLDEFKPKKIKNDKGDDVYLASLNVDARLNREDTDKETYINYTCYVSFKDNFKIVSFNLKKISSY